MPETDTQQRSIAREDLTREKPFVLTRAAAADSEPDDGFTLDGIGAVFNTPTLIDSWEGTFEEEIAPGAFKKSLRENRPRMQFDHGHHPLIGSIPIGTFSEGYPAEEPEGLRVVGRLFDNWLIEPVRMAIATNAIDGMSFRFSVVREEWRDADGKKLTNVDDIVQGIYYPEEGRLLRRVLRELKIREVGPVVWPAYEETSVGMRSRGTIDLARLHDPEQRKTLALAVFMADRAQAEHENDEGPQSNGTPGDHSVEVAPEVATRDDAPEPEVSDTPSGEHPQQADTTPRTSLRDRITAWELGVMESASTRTMIITDPEEG
jgi:uncharacterized protein